MSKSVLKIALCCLTFAFSLQPLSLSAEENPVANRVQLTQLKDKISKEEGRLSGLREQTTSLEKELSKLNKDMQQLTQDRASTEREAEQAVQQLKVSDSKVSQHRQFLDEHSARVNKRLLAMYHSFRQGTAFRLLWASRSGPDFFKRAYYLRAVATADRELLTTALSTLIALESEQRTQQQIKNEQQNRLSRLKNIERDYQFKKDHHTKVLADQQMKLALLEKSIEKLKSSASELEKALEGLTGADEATVDSSLPQPQIKLSGLSSLRGKLSFPVLGAKIIQRFGRQKFEQFADIIFSKGLEVKAQAAVKVRAIANGQVALSENLPAYGNVLIIDHGERYYSLYGRLAKPLRNKGDLVQSGEAIAELGEPDFRGRNFYFELRIKGKPSDPLEYFADKPTSIKLDSVNNE